MKEESRVIRVEFIDVTTFKAYKKLKESTFEDKRLAKYIDSAIDDLKKNPLIGVRIPKVIWPKEYVKKYGVDNLRKYDLPDGWRLVYTLVGNKIEIISVILEWYDHKNYEKRFGYKVR